MEAATGAFPSIHLTERYEELEEKHQKDLAILESKVERLKWSNNDTLKQLFEFQTRGNRLAQSLGFNDIYEAQVAIDTADRQTPYKECFELAERLGVELSAAQLKNDKLQEQIRLLEHERKELKMALASAERSCIQVKSDASQHKSTIDRFSQELKALQLRYDALLDVKDRAAARYKVDYAKWRNFRRWLYEDNKGIDEEGISEGEKEKRAFTSIMRKKKVMTKFGLGGAWTDGGASSPHPPLGGIINLDCDKEILTTPSPDKRRHLADSTMTASSTAVGSSASKSSSSTSPGESVIKSAVHETPLSPFPIIFQDNSIFEDTKQPQTFHRSPTAGSTALYSSSYHSKNKRSSLAVMNAMSSDTEDDSQAVGQFPAPFGPFKVPTLPATLPPGTEASQTQQESQSPIFPVAVPSKPVVPTPQSGAYRSNYYVVTSDADSLQPLKMRRLSRELTESPSVKTPTLKSGWPPQKGKTENKENEAQLTPANVVNSNAKKLTNYSEYKGRGRYAKEVETARNTINAQYVINPVRNGGLDFQYDEVVRGKQDRRHLDAGDCECCRDYYEAVGPLPKRLQAPLWRSPTSSPTKPRAQQNQNISASAMSVDRCRAEIQSHRKAISRHRHHWERAKTPPGYWNIGFPDTQEAAAINQKAREMHENKRAEVDAAAREGGKYKRRS